MTKIVKRVFFAGAVVALGGYAVVQLRGPHGLPALLEKRRVIDQLERENERLAEQVREKKFNNEEMENKDSDLLKLKIKEKRGKVEEGERVFQTPGGEGKDAEGER